MVVQAREQASLESSLKLRGGGEVSEQAFLGGAWMGSVAIVMTTDGWIAFGEVWSILSYSSGAKGGPTQTCEDKCRESKETGSMRGA